MRLDSVRSAMARVVAVLAVVACAAASAGFAQGVTSASLRGHVLDESGSPVEGALVTAINVATGARYVGRSRAGGLYNIENLALGRYAIEGRAIGYRPVRIEGTRLALGQVATVELRLPQSTVELAAVTVPGEEPNPLISAARTGASSYVSDSVILRLPTLGRNFTDFIANVPQVVGTSVAGMNNRLNNIQIDGAVNNDLFGLASGGTPGGNAGARPISVEAVREFQVLIAPFDVRQGGFTGGIVNVVTRSGTNEFRGGAFTYYTNQSFQSSYKDSTGFVTKPVDFNRAQYGFSLSGPIIRDRLHFFTVVDLSRRQTPYSTVGQITPDTTGGADSVGIGIRWNTAERVRQILAGRGYDVGGPVGPTSRNPDTNILLKLSGQLGSSSQFELSHNSVVASDVNLYHRPTSANDGYQLSESGYSIESKVHSTRLNLRSAFGGSFTNELIVGLTTVRDARTLANRIPRLVINGDRCAGLAAGSLATCGVILAAGGERSSMANTLDQDIIEVTDNLTFPLGQHLFTVGTHNEFFKFNNLFLQNAFGTWWFANADSLAAGAPYQYSRAIELREDPGRARMNVKQLGVYLQDRWTPTPRLTLTMGLRYDVPKLGTSPTYNQRLDSIFYVGRGGSPASFAPGAAGGINTGRLSLKGLWSPRIGFNFDASGNGSTVLRGGAGVFTGRPAYVWVSNIYGNTGMEQATVTCNGSAISGGTPSTADTIPIFTLRLDSLANRCSRTTLDRDPTFVPPSNVNFYDPDFKFPQTFRAALGVDHRLPWGIVGTFDLLYTQYMNTYYITDLNLRGPVGRAFGEGQRVMYGTISATSGASSPSRVNSAYNAVLRHENRGGDRAYSLTVQMQKRFSNSMEFSAGYTYSRAWDYISLGSSVALSNYQYTALDGTLEHRNLRRSLFDRPHRFVASGSFSLPYQINAGFRLTIQSGQPYAYTYTGDANGDSLRGNDLVYVPMYSSDISLQTPSDWTKLNNYVNSEPCLSSQRGRIMERNSCRNPVQTFLDGRVSKLVRTFGGQSVEFSVDIFNLPRLLGTMLENNWGEVRSTAANETISLLSLRGYSAAMGRGIYRLDLPIRRQVSITSSRWQMQFGARYMF